MKAILLLQNLKCNDGADKVLQKAIKADGISNPKVDILTSTLTVEYLSYNALMGLSMELTELGYPIRQQPISYE
jgi:hypothetical protein